MNSIFGRIAVATTIAAGVALMAAPSMATVANCANINTIGQWYSANNDSCTLGDKTFKLIDTDLANSYVINFDVSGLSYSFIGDGNIGPDDEFVKYSVTVNDVAYKITGVRLDSDITGTSNGISNTTVTKKLYDSNGNLIDTLLSTGGSTDSSIPLNTSYLLVRDDIHVASGATLQSFNNTFDQSPVGVPEPMTLGLLGMGLLGLGAAARRRRAA